MDSTQAELLLCLVTQCRDYLALGVWVLALLAGQISVNSIMKARDRKWF